MNSNEYNSQWTKHVSTYMNNPDSQRINDAEFQLMWTYTIHNGLTSNVEFQLYWEKCEQTNEHDS